MCRAAIVVNATGSRVTIARDAGFHELHLRSLGKISWLVDDEPTAADTRLHSNHDVP